MNDLIVKGAGEIKDGLYNIKDGKLFQYKANGGTVRTYPIVSADRPKWIPCSERLPEIDKRVIVTGTMWGMWEVDIDRWNGERWVKYCGYVSAWMPLPEPYKESDTDGSN